MVDEMIFPDLLKALKCEKSWLWLVSQVSKALLEV